ncbi:MAG: hypothetical protein ABIZ81_17605 [Opitutaceae bacterium]
MKTTLAAQEKTSDRPVRKRMSREAVRRRVTGRAGRIIIPKVAVGERVTDEEMRRVLDV